MHKYWQIEHTIVNDVWFALEHEHNEGITNHTLELTSERVTHWTIQVKQMLNTVPIRSIEYERSSIEYERSS